MKSGWQVKELGEIFEIARGGSPRPIDSYLTVEPNGINWIKIGDTKGVTKYITTTKEKIKPEGAKRSRMVYERDFILSNSMSFGRPYIMKTSGCIHDGWLVLSQKVKTVNQDYLFHVLSSDFVFQQFDDAAAGSTVRNLNIGLVSRVKISFPPLPEQQRIVTIIDEAFEGIAAATANAERNLSNARQVFQSYLASVFGEPQRSTLLGDIADVQSGGTPLISTKAFWGGKIPWYSSGELNRQHTGNPERYITEAGLNGSNAKLFPKGSLLIGMYDTAALKMSILDRDGAFNQAIAGVKPNKNIDLAFILHSINAGKPEILSQRRGVRQKNLSLTKIKEISLYIPALSEQQKIVSKLSALSTEVTGLESIYQQKLVALTELKKSILHQAFTGQLH